MGEEALYMTYRLGWSVVPQILIQRERWPGGNAQGIPLVSPGQHVLPDQPILRFERSEPIETMQTIPHLPLASSAANAPGVGHTSGKNSTGTRVETLPAGLRGQVVSITDRGGVVIESRAAVLQGAIGAGNQVAGVLTIWQAALADTSGRLTIPPGALLVVPGPVSFALLRSASVSGVVGLIASSVALRDLEGFLRTDVVRLLNSGDVESAQAKLPKISLLFTEGSGNIAMPVRTINLLSRYAGSIALLSGVTSAKQQLFPELVISLPPQETEQHWQPQKPDTTIKIGAKVRVCSGDYRGMVGEVDYLFTHQQFFSSGLHARAARIRLEDGSLQVVPLTAIERAS
jgi:transcription antitermination factor NusG